MKTIQLAVNERMALIGLDRGRSNAINFEMLQELKSLLENIEQDDTIAGIIIHGKERFFSSGLDLIELYDYDEKQIREFWNLFLQVAATLVSFKKPSVAAISGHSPAGGCVIALCCDYRIMNEGDFIIGLNEVPVGLIVPTSIFSLYKFWLGERKAYQYLMEGKLLNPEEALQQGLVDQVVKPEKLRSEAEKRLLTYIQFDANAWQQTKLNIRRQLIAEFNQVDNAMLDGLVKQWWDPSTRSILKTIITNLTNKK